MDKMGLRWQYLVDAIERMRIKFSGNLHSQVEGRGDFTQIYIDALISRANIERKMM